MDSSCELTRTTGSAGSSEVYRLVDGLQELYRSLSTWAMKKTTKEEAATGLHGTMDGRTLLSASVVTPPLSGPSPLP